MQRGDYRPAPRQASTESGEDSFDGAVIAIPAAFNQMQTEATLRAAKLAGLENVELIQEPVAAAMASMAGAKRSGKFLVYDLGGGTFDVALLEADHGEVRIIAQQGVNMLGGRDFDRMIVSEVVASWLLANFDLPETFMRDPAYRRLARIAQLAAEKAKIELSSQEETSIFASDDEVRLSDQSETEIFLDAPVTRSQFEELIRQPIEHTIAIIQRLLEDNDVSTADVDRVVFVGGPSRIPLVRRLVTESLGIAADLKTDPMTAVAEGAAYFCESRLWKPAPAIEEAETPALSASEPKPTEAHMEMPEESGLSFDYPSRTPDEKAAIVAHVSGDPAGRLLRLTGKGWESETMALADGLSLSAPLNAIGENLFDVHVTDASGDPLKEHAQTLKIKRLVAAPKELPAAQTIGVKVRKSLESDENSFILLVKKGDPLPASGQIKLKSAATLKSGAPGFIGFEVFQIEYPERVELNLCVGLFRIDGTDLPKGHVIRVGEPLVFDWTMSQGGLLQTSVKLPASNLELKAPRFYAPQAGQLSFQNESGLQFTRAILQRAEEEWGDLAAAVGPDGGPETILLKARLDEQREILEESVDDPEPIRRVSEEARFIRQDTVRLGRKYTPALLQRQLGKLSAAFNRVCRGKSEEQENKAFDDLAEKVQKIIDSETAAALPAAELCLAEMRRLFFAVAWRDPSYVQTWLHRMASESWLFADQEEFESLIEEGKKLERAGDQTALREVVLRLLAARMALGASDAVNELASIVKGYRFANQFLPYCVPRHGLFKGEKHERPDLYVFGTRRGPRLSRETSRKTCCRLRFRPTKRWFRSRIFLFMRNTSSTP
jgi:molecular chaperone DnaK